MTKEAKKTLRHVLGSIQDAIEDMGCAMGEVENEYEGMDPDSEEANAAYETITLLEDAAEDMKRIVRGIEDALTNN